MIFSGEANFHQIQVLVIAQLGEPVPVAQIGEATEVITSKYMKYMDAVSACLYAKHNSQM